MRDDPRTSSISLARSAAGVGHGAGIREGLKPRLLRGGGSRFGYFGGCIRNRSGSGGLSSRSRSGGRSLGSRSRSGGRSLGSRSRDLLSGTQRHDRSSDGWRHRRSSRAGHRWRVTGRRRWQTSSSS